jgi:ketosteroid isomerase-like protein
MPPPTMPSTQSEIRALLDRRSVPGRQYIGSAALRRRFLEWFDGFEAPIGQEIRELHISASGDDAIALSGKG